ncbi:hypothetical protein MBGDN05_00066 [Thermoplasmatales archaeon SCGC AB-539-N05]|nr:hypothetical protein MBGDN05_00066 [Thermoplasmatales archaeon SCGC AB-539-N05]
MKQRIQRDKLMFRWFTKNHEIVVGFKHVQYGKCNVCGKRIPSGNTMCDECFNKVKHVSKK